MGTRSRLWTLRRPHSMSAHVDPTPRRMFRVRLTIFFENRLRTKLRVVVGADKEVGVVVGDADRDALPEKLNALHRVGVRRVVKSGFHSSTLSRVSRLNSLRCRFQKKRRPILRRCFHHSPAGTVIPFFIVAKSKLQPQLTGGRGGDSNPIGCAADFFRLQPKSSAQTTYGSASRP